MKTARHSLCLLWILAWALGCSTPEKRRETLLPAVEDYNEMIRWKRPERAMPHVHPDRVRDFRDWSEEHVKQYDYQEWRVRGVDYHEEVSATVDIERTGFEIPRYIEEKFRVKQVWVDTGDNGWKIREGF